MAINRKEKKGNSMKKLILPAVIAGAVFAAPAFASETEDFCNAFATEFDLGTEPCACVGEVGEANPEVKEQILALTHPDETEAWDDDTKEALSVCFPQGS